MYSKNVEQLLINAFAGESMARNRYDFYAKIADKEGYKEIRDIFLETAQNEHEHAKLFYKHISKGHHFVDAEYPFFIGTTVDNLKAASEGENEEWEIIYKKSAEIASDEGFDDIAKLFRCIIEVEKHHAHRYNELYNELINDSFFKKEFLTQWECKNCGYILTLREAPMECPCCNHSQGYFKIFCEKY